MLLCIDFGKNPSWLMTARARQVLDVFYAAELLSFAEAQQYIP